MAKTMSNKSIGPGVQVIPIRLTFIYGSSSFLAVRFLVFSCVGKVKIDELTK